MLATWEEIRRKAIAVKDERAMHTDLNHVTLTGVLARDPITRFADHGTQQVRFRLQLTEVGPAGQACTLFVPVEAYSQVAALAGDLNSGDAVLVAGKLTWISHTAKDGTRKSTLAVLARLVKRLAPAAVETTA
jgi:single-stranded DNA-binding protein